MVEGRRGVAHLVWQGRPEPAFWQGLALGVACGLSPIIGFLLGPPGLTLGMGLVFGLPVLGLLLLSCWNATWRTLGVRWMGLFVGTTLAAFALIQLMRSFSGPFSGFGLRLFLPWTVSVLALATLAHALALPAWRDRALGLALGYGLLTIGADAWTGLLVGSLLLAAALTFLRERLRLAASLAGFAFWAQAWSGEPWRGAWAGVAQVLVAALAVTVVVWRGRAVARGALPTPPASPMAPAVRGVAWTGALAFVALALALLGAGARTSGDPLVNHALASVWVLAAAAFLAAWSAPETSRAAVLGWSGALLLVGFALVDPARSWLAALPGFLVPWLALGIRLRPASRAALVLLQYVAMVPLFAPFSDGAVSTNLILAVGTLHLLLVWGTLPVGPWRRAVLAFGAAGAGIVAAGAVVVGASSGYTPGRWALLAAGAAGIGVCAALALAPRLRAARLPIPEWTPWPARASRPQA